ncbi:MULTISPECIES: methanogenesis marker 5 protein [Methanobacterium]|uniref:Methanogenesis marker 5 protein n=2 Tax=Methanobacterium formicicum TaxID=2162 RepID=A0A089ZUV2_METFO|nr:MULTISPECIES: methanogenesis marker 5 protein [Methanobacterium]AIS31329.1 methanogenesis marker protein 5 [Methanobacterium formicicum]KUK75269.1 MAG: Methanogenesis marker protein 5 [Methanobacterium sp. 42_16]MBF4475567.1 methanogenesis marker 5 protein [Methanobacterium formicicum]MDD4810162.1 methanogenesis marker 5 protein [Methanobacterium formicicum]MDG3547826.1 methanogenesis marker 5 protein [Methanobacterium formicicum]
MKIAVFPPNSLILADMVERKGHEPLVIQKEIRKKVTDPEIDSPPFNITEEEPIKGLKYAAIEVPSGVRGRMAIFGPIIDEAEAAIIMEDAPYGFGCIGCARTNELSMYFLRKRGIPVLEIHYPESKDETVEVINKINTFLDGLDKSESDEKAEPEKDTKETVEE